MITITFHLNYVISHLLNIVRPFLGSVSKDQRYYVLHLFVKDKAICTNF